MRILVISDIHANVTAFRAVLAAAAGQWDVIWFLGDLVGYGPDPNECITLLREQEHLGLSGNHDWAVLGRLNLTAFNDAAQAAIIWTQSVLLPENRAYLEDLPPLAELETFTLVHASPREPVWEYVLDAQTAAANFEHFATPYCLMGHSHVPLFFVQDAAEGALAYLPYYDAAIQLDGERLMINPGSVGQPRDHDPRAAFALLDTETFTWTHRRVAYEVEETQQRMRTVGLPERLIQRLAFGY